MNRTSKEACYNEAVKRSEAIRNCIKYSLDDIERLIIEEYSLDSLSDLSSLISNLIEDLEDDNEVLQSRVRRLRADRDAGEIQELIADSFRP